MATEVQTALTNVFNHKDDIYEYSTRWTSLGPESAPPLILIHGTPWSSRVWASYAISLSQRFKVYLFDNPGYGLTPAAKPLHNSAGEPSVSLATQARAFAALYHSCWNFSQPGKQIPHVIAHDFGGIITLRAHILQDCAYASLCLIDVVAVRPFGSPFFNLVAANRGVFTSVLDTVFNGMVRAYINDAKYKPLSPEVEDMLCKPWRKGERQGPEAFVRQIVQTDQKDVEEVEGRYEQVGKNMPVKVIWGIEDRWIPVEAAERVGKALGAKKVVLVEEAGHLIMFDQPERLAFEIAFWLNEVDGVVQK